VVLQGRSHSKTGGEKKTSEALKREEGSPATADDTVERGRKFPDGGKKYRLKKKGKRGRSSVSPALSRGRRERAEKKKKKKKKDAVDFREDPRRGRVESARKRSMGPLSQGEGGPGIFATSAREVKKKGIF